MRVLARMGGLIRHLALSVSEVGWFRAWGPVGVVGSQKVVLWSEEEFDSDSDSEVSEDEGEDFFFEDGEFDDDEVQIQMFPAPEFKALESVTFVADCERVLMGMEEKFGIGAETDFEHAVWEWVADDPDSEGDRFPAPIQRTNREDEEDNPYWQLHRDKVENVERVLADDDVRNAYENAGIEVRFELWRRPRQKGKWVKRFENIGGGPTQVR